MQDEILFNLTFIINFIILPNYSQLIVISI